LAAGDAGGGFSNGNIIYTYLHVFLCNGFAEMQMHVEQGGNIGCNFVSMSTSYTSWNHGTIELDYTIYPPLPPSPPPPVMGPNSGSYNPLGNGFFNAS
jgi:hypothetical protein